jgi:hypothetical protein
VSDETRTYLVEAGTSRGGVTVRNGVVVETAPVFRWMVTRQWGDVKAWQGIKSIQETAAADEPEIGSRAYQERVEAEGQLRLVP